MPVVVVANPKGGVGKSTVATHIAGHFASQGHAVMLGDADRQQSSRLWLNLRPPAARPIQGWEVGDGKLARPPKGTTHVVIDTPAGLHGKELRALLESASKVVVPLSPSVFDIFATRAFLDELAGHHKTSGLPVAIVGNRVDPRTLAADQLQAFVKGLGLPVLGELRPTQNYVHLAARGLTVFDLAPARVERDLAQWAPITRWLDS
ncbi:ParA family protein [Ramlibacter tataouinensis]|uniref:ParA family protein n=1 Tax=Ramlibacter tataouinensis TaxID=94132 RepID=UPI0022F3FE8C|nr:ParA family protein [Ramlibacter tataouinensis]WBY03687.1 ParA family protein [Ramlibacter tataouinensis]